MAEYISKSAANLLRESGINYLDVAGNAYINTDDLFIYIEGQKRSVKLKPEKFTIYSNKELPVIARSLNLVPDPDGNVEVVQKFWHDEESDKTIVPALLIYADLINSGFGRNIEIANYVLNNELQHIQ